MTPAYATRPYTCPEARTAGFHDVRAEVRWTPRSGATRVRVGAYLDADAPDGVITLGCGIEEAVTDLGLDDLVFPRGHDYLETIWGSVNRQLLRRPSADLVCPEGRLLVVLVQWRGGPG